MPLWGKQDNLASQPKYVSRTAFFNSTAVNAANDTINILSANTGFATGDAVLYSINGGTVIGGLTNATTYYVRNVGTGVIELYDTFANAINLSATAGRVNITGAGVGTQTLQRVGNIGNTFGDSNYNGKQVLFVDREESRTQEARSKGLHSPGWWVYRTWTNADGSVQHSGELLVAMDVTAATSGDADDDAILPDPGVITIDVEPQDETVTEGGAVTFTVEASITSDSTLAYQWQELSGEAWVDIDGEDADTIEFTTTTLADDGRRFRVVVSAVAAEPVTSEVATLTVEEDLG